MTLKLAFTAAVAAAAIVAGGAASAQTRTKFEFWYGLTGDLGNIMAEHCKRFNESQTKYEAVCTTQGGYDKAEQNTIAAFRSKQHPTMVQIYDAGTVNFMLSGAVKKASELVTKYNVKLDWNDYFPGISNYYATSKGEMWSFPYNSSTAMFYWNKDVWKQIGKDKAPATWEEFEADLKAIKASGHACPFAYDLGTWQNIEQMSAIHNWPIATKNNGYDGLDAEVTFNKTGVVKHHENLKRWYDEGLLKIQTAKTGKPQVQAFSDGTCASMLSSIADHGTVGKTKKDGLNWTVDMIPLYAGAQRHNSLVGGASLWVLDGKSDAEYEAVMAFAAFITKPEEALWFSTYTGYIPVLNSGYKFMQDKGFYKEATYAGREKAIESLTASPVGPLTRGIRLGNFTSIRAELTSELEAIFTQNKNVQQAFDDAATRSNQILRRFEQTFKGRQLP